MLSSTEHSIDRSGLPLKAPAFSPEQTWKRLSHHPRGRLGNRDTLTPWTKAEKCQNKSPKDS